MSLRLPSVIPKGDEVAFRDDRGDDTSSEEALRFWHHFQERMAVALIDLVVECHRAVGLVPECFCVDDFALHQARPSLLGRE